MLALTLTLSQLIEIIAFNSHFNSLASPYHLPTLKKKMRKIITLHPSAWRGQLCFKDSKVRLFHRITEKLLKIGKYFPIIRFALQSGRKQSFMKYSFLVY